MENAPTWTAERKRGTKGPAEPHGPWRCDGGPRLVSQEKRQRAGLGGTMPKLPGAAADTRPGPALPRTGPETPWGGASAGSASLRRLVLLATCLRQSALGATEDTAQPGRRRPCSQHGLLGTLSPSLRPAAQKKIPFKTCLPLDGAPGPARAPRLREAVRDTHGRLRRRPMRDTAGPAPAFGSRGHRIEGVGAACRTPARRTHDSRAPWDTGTPVITRAARGTVASGTQAPSGARARNRTSPAQGERGELDPAARRGPAAADQTTWKYSLESTGGRAGASPTAERRLQRQPHRKLLFGLFRIFCGLM